MKFIMCFENYCKTVDIMFYSNLLFKLKKQFLLNFLQKNTFKEICNNISKLNINVLNIL